MCWKEVSLLSSGGTVLCADACSETISLPLGSDRGAVPSPSALGFWPRNIGRGDFISITKCETQRKVEARRDVYSLKVECDLTLIDRQSDSLQVELRLLTREGALIESELPSYRNRDGAFVFCSAVVPQEIVAHYPSLQCIVPLIAFELDAGLHNLLAEVIIFDREKSIVCGDICEISIDMPLPIPGQRAEIEDIRADAPTKIDSPLFVEQIVIDSSYQFNSRDALRVEVVVLDQAPVFEPMQSRLSLAAPGGAAHARGLSLLRHSQTTEQSLLYVFDCDEVLKLAGDARELIIHFELLDRKGEIQLSTTRNIFLAPHFGLEKGVPSSAIYGRNEVEIVDAQIRETPQRGGELLLNVTANFDTLACEKQNYALYIEPLRTPRSAKPEPGLASDGFYVEFPPPKAAQQSAPPMKLLQEAQLVRVPFSQQNSGAYGLKLMLLSPSGRLLQVVYQKFSVKKTPA